MTKIAIVEDNKAIRESLTRICPDRSGMPCVCACATAEEALKQIPKHQPDIVLMDIQLPNMSGIECTAQLKQLLPAVQIIMVTVYEDTERIFKALRAGACGYLLKRCTPEELVSAIREVREGGAPDVAGNRPQGHRLLSADRPNGRGGGGSFAPRTGNSGIARPRICPTRKSPAASVSPTAPCAGICGMFITSCTSAPEPRPRLSFFRPNQNKLAGRCFSQIDRIASAVRRRQNESRRKWVRDRPLFKVNEWLLMNFSRFNRV